VRHVLLTFSLVASLLTVVQGQEASACRDWQECRLLALDASARREYERFHDLAWRALQTGPRNDSGLMYLLARAQVLSGRRHDALVMLQRLAEMGVVTDAVSDPDFGPARELPGWPEVANAIARAGTATSSPGLEPAREPPDSRQPRRRRPNPTEAAAAAAGTAVIAPLATVPFPLEPAPMSDAARFSTGNFLAAGLAYDAVSRRFVIGDALGQKLIVVAAASDHAEDMVHRDSAGFDDVVALDIDEKRGDLWVATAEATEGTSALHRLQLVSARPLKTYRTSPSIGSTRLVDLTVQASGDVVALDGSGNRLLALARGGSDMTVAMSLKFSNAKSVAARGDSMLYVAHDAGIARVDLRSGTIAELAAPTGLDLRRFDVIRVHRNALIGRQTTPAGTRQLVRLNLNAAGLAVRDGTVIDPQVPETGGQLSLSITGDELYYLTTVSDGTVPPPSSNRTPMAEQFVVRRLTLR
jgi:hypothetical protein